MPRLEGLERGYGQGVRLHLPTERRWVLAGDKLVILLRGTQAGSYRITGGRLIKSQPTPKNGTYV